VADSDGIGRDGRLIVTALTATKLGDRIVDVKTVLPWLFGALGVPTVLLGLLVPIRESGSMLPQAALLPVVRARAHRSGLWLLGAAGQAVAVGVMAVVAVTLRGAVAGVAVLAALAGFATARSLCSLTSKDVMGRTVAKGTRGRVTGTATTLSGVIAITLGLALRQLGPDTTTRAFGLLLAGGAAMWVVATWPFARVDEPAGEHDDEVDASAIGDGLRLLRDDAAFRRFVVARTLLLVSALTPPYVLALAQSATGDSIAGLGPFVVASGVAGLVGGRLWGGFADRSSRLVVAGAAGAASLVVVVFLLTEGSADGAAFYVGSYFLLALAHTAARVGRKTYVVDLGDGNARTDYVAVSNSVMAVLLLVVGGLTGLLSALGPDAALVALAAIGALGVPAALSLPEVSAGRDPDRADADADDEE
jgi:hypothetical protein